MTHTANFWLLTWPMASKTNKKHRPRLHNNPPHNQTKLNNQTNLNNQPKLVSQPRLLKHNKTLSPMQFQIYPNKNQKKRVHTVFYPLFLALITTTGRQDHQEEVPSK